VSLLQSIKGRPDIRKQLRYPDRRSFVQFINSLLPLAGQVERLAPNFAGTMQPNPEYPWRDPATGNVEVPVRYAFPAFDPGGAQMIKLERLITELLRIMN